MDDDCSCVDFAAAADGDAVEKTLKSLVLEKNRSPKGFEFDDRYEQRWGDTAGGNQAAAEPA